MTNKMRTEKSFPIRQVLMPTPTDSLFQGCFGIYFNERW